jgi:hypothetical protein
VAVAVALLGASADTGGPAAGSIDDAELGATTAASCQRQPALREAVATAGAAPAWAGSHAGQQLMVCCCVLLDRLQSCSYQQQPQELETHPAPSGTVRPEGLKPGSSLLSIEGAGTWYGSAAVHWG